MKLISVLMRKSWRTMLVAAIIGGASGLSNVALLAIIHRTLRNPGASPAYLLWLFVAFCVVVLVTRAWSQLLLTRLGQDSISELRLGLCRRILESPLRHLEDIGSHRMLASLTTDVVVITQAMSGIPTVCVNAIILIFGAAYLGTLSFSVLVAAVAFCAAGIGSFKLFSHWARGYILVSREAQDTLMKHLRNMIHGIKELKMHHDRRQEFVGDVLLPTESIVRENQYIGSCLQDFAISWGRLLFLVAIGLLLFLWPRIQPLDAATLTGYTLAIFYLMSPLERILAWLPLLSRAEISVRKIERLGLMLDQEAVEELQLQATPSWSRIDLAGVTHEYHREGQDHGFQLGPIHLTLHRNEITFLVGGNGSGKTTLAKLVAGLYFPAGGEIRLDGVPVNGKNRETYRQLIAAVFDDAVVFDGLWGLQGPDLDDRAQRLLHELKLNHVVKISDRTFSTTDLSRGQRKRLALLTAYLEDRDVYLFDEWAADQDPVFKQVFYQQLLPDLKRRGKTVIAITHDDRYFPMADRVIKLEEGHILTDSPPQNRPALAMEPL
jgi:putative ATP-binding cassette transporter